jgi:PadR family transcriptional regulator PadR
MRTTYALVHVALALMSAPGDRHWGYELSRTSGVRSGVLYPILRRMFEEEWLADGWERPEELTESRPPRRYYTLTEKGLRELGALLVTAQADPRFRGLQVGWA